jgi:hypothetical protein
MREITEQEKQVLAQFEHMLKSKDEETLKRIEEGYRDEEEPTNETAGPVHD